MPRRPRIDLPGYHHIVNRGVNRTNIFSDPDDKEKFMQILCKACRIYDVVVHDYCLMDNHYHILVENSQVNLSLFMRQLNSNYAIYYNKKVKRTGHLWQGRYSSWYIMKDEYLYRTIRYIEYNPIEAGMSAEIAEYPYTLGSVLLGKMDMPKCCTNSMLVKQYDIDTLADFLDKALSKEEIKGLEQEKRKKISKIKDKAVQGQKKELDSYFDRSMDKQKRNSAIVEAYKDGHTQASIAKEIGISDAMVCVVIKKLRFNTP
jgi:REP element-mobilizing transposase RayT